MSQRAFIIFDWDNTLFKTREFWREYLFPSYSAEAQIAEKIIEESFITSTTKKIDYFLPKYFLDEIKDHTPHISGKNLQAIFYRIVFDKAAQKYFYPGALSLLKRAKNKKYQMMLLSYGDKSFKQKFFEVCGVYDFFRPELVYITNKKKIEAMVSIPQREEYIIINDVLKETEDLIKLLEERGSKVTTYLFDPLTKIEKNDLILSSLKLCKNLKEIKI